MAILQPLFDEKASQRALLALAYILLPWTALAEQEFSPGFPLRNQNPFLQIFGLPPFQSAALAAKGAIKWDLSLDVANHADARDTSRESFVIDGESYFLGLALRRGIGNRLELGIDVPLVAHADGFLDNAIENWHNTFGMSNSKRLGPSNQLRFFYAGAGSAGYALDSPRFGIGDIQLTAAIPLREASDERELTVALRTSIKLPTGDSDALLGSGAADISVGAYVAGTGTLWNRDLDISAFLGALLLGEGNVLSEIQRNALPYGGIAATWHATERLAVGTQLSAQGAYFDSTIEELGGDSVQLAVGAYYSLPDRKSSLGFAIVEDISANATTDFALHFSFRTNGAR